MWAARHDDDDDDSIFIVSCNEVSVRERKKKNIPDRTNSRMTTSSRQGKQEESGLQILKESYSSYQRSQAVIGCCQNSSVILINRAISAVIGLVWKIGRMRVDVRSMPTGSFGWGRLMLQDPKPPVNPKETSLMTHPNASIRIYIYIYTYIHILYILIYIYIYINYLLLSSLKVWYPIAPNNQTKRNHFLRKPASTYT